MYRTPENQSLAIALAVPLFSTADATYKGANLWEIDGFVETLESTCDHEAEALRSRLNRVRECWANSGDMELCRAHIDVLNEALLRRYEVARLRNLANAHEALARAAILSADANTPLPLHAISLDAKQPTEIRQPNTSTAAEASTWLSIARKIALEFIQRHREKGLAPGLQDVSDHVATALRSAAIYGHHRRPLSAAYIKRNALQGEWWKKNKPQRD
ncbi:Hypothetical protein H16_B2380 [Cupriavidus necator H16]|uniref:Uncharacterized protein n=1 Tax=Cupriavidus necator (strain ATCC 17699 / DSM 428 / KCTC 22496 / NCIMB 10442 / H16 / Stanier 337) TaxID=381666 RepID=Q0JYL2_CUPNH|nr:Hypothetical protein H16_B2380 [Cupriavidus necator H16]